MTATATEAVRRDICHTLRMVNPVVTVTSFDRPNLYIQVAEKTNIVNDIMSLPCVSRITTKKAVKHPVSEKFFEILSLKKYYRGG